MRKTFFISLLVLFSFGLWVACGDGDSDSSSPPAVDVTGTWTGSWFSNNGVKGVNGGSATLNATQSRASVTGSVSLSGSPCFARGAFSGSV